MDVCEGQTWIEKHTNPSKINGGSNGGFLVTLERERERGRERGGEAE